MPNVQPEDLPIQASTPAAPLAGWPCGYNACVDMVDNGDGTYAIRSTRRPEMPSVLFDPDEIVKFDEQMKSGEWEHIVASARARLNAAAAV